MKYPDGLSQTAQAAYHSFVAMSESKAAHFACLQEIEALRESGGTPSIAKSLELQGLLSNHDENVQAFSTAMALVKDNDEKLALVELMT